ncbi:MAG: ArdC family protein, partial [Actinomycetota bacterium]|nr:ArdC family protein [Actinomycetota bacterium]
TGLIWGQSIARGFTPRRVAGYRAWQELGRHVRKGERGLQILAPVIRKVTPDNEEEEEKRVVGFRVVHVFDIAQTDGEPLPEVPITLVEGDLPSHWEQVRGLITESGFDLQVADVDRLGEANGVTDWNWRDVVVRASLPGAQRFKTAVRELAHIRLHEHTFEVVHACGVEAVRSEGPGAAPRVVDHGAVAVVMG